MRRLGGRKIEKQKLRRRRRQCRVRAKIQTTTERSTLFCSCMCWVLFMAGLSLPLLLLVILYFICVNSALQLRENSTLLQTGNMYVLHVNEWEGAWCFFSFFSDYGVYIEASESWIYLKSINMLGWLEFLDIFREIMATTKMSGNFVCAHISSGVYTFYVLRSYNTRRSVSWRSTTKHTHTRCLLNCMIVSLFHSNKVLFNHRPSTACIVLFYYRYFISFFFCVCV